MLGGCVCGCCLFVCEFGGGGYGLFVCLLFLLFPPPPISSRFLSSSFSGIPGKLRMRTRAFVCACACVTRDTDSCVCICLTVDVCVSRMCIMSRRIVCVCLGGGGGGLAFLEERCRNWRSVSVQSVSVLLSTNSSFGLIHGNKDKELTSRSHAWWSVVGHYGGPAADNAIHQYLQARRLRTILERWKRPAPALCGNQVRLA